MFVISGKLTTVHAPSYPVTSLPLGYLDFIGTRPFGSQITTKVYQDTILIQA
jgi:hypothetical protein